MPWTVHLEGGPRRVNHAAVAVGEKIYSFGGYCTGDDYRQKRPMEVHVLNTGTVCCLYFFHTHCVITWILQSITGGQC